MDLEGVREHNEDDNGGFADCGGGGRGIFRDMVSIALLRVRKCSEHGKTLTHADNVA